jgi:hypothetical protein
MHAGKSRGVRLLISTPIQNILDETAGFFVWRAQEAWTVVLFTTSGTQPGEKGAVSRDVMDWDRYEAMQAFFASTRQTGKEWPSLRGSAGRF